jgi:diacylglycerol kinase (ATP)
MQAKLIFNPASGNPTESAVQLVELLRHLQAQKIETEVILVQPEMHLGTLAHNAAHDGAKLVIVSGGDGTIENVALGLVGSKTTLGIIPTGTRNNLARSLNIPTNDLAAAVALVRDGRRLKIDIGLMRHRKSSRSFLEAGIIGLASALYSSADDFQHGDYARITEFISTLVAAAPSEIRLCLDHQRNEIVANSHLVLVANMPYIGANFQIAPDVPFDDRRLDVFVYSDLNKRDLVGQAMQASTRVPDARIQRFRARRVTITANPAMSVMADGVSLGDGGGAITMTLHPHRLRVMAGLPTMATTGVPPMSVIEAAA